VEILELDDDVGSRAGTFVDPFLHRLAFDNVAELHGAIDFGDDRRGVRIPFRDQLSRLHVVAFGLAQLGAVDERVALAFTLADMAVLALNLRGDDDLAVPGHHDQVAVAAGYRVHIVQPDDAFSAWLQRGLLGAPAGGAADVESTHRELGSRFADRLRGDNSDRLAEVDQMSAAEVASVAAHADSSARLAGQHRANLDSLDSRVLGTLDLV